MIRKALFPLLVLFALLSSQISIGYALFGLLAVELAVSLTAQRGSMLSHVLAGVFFLVAVVFVWRSFYAMRIQG